MSDFTIHLKDNTITSHSHRVEPRKVTPIDTGGKYRKREDEWKKISKILLETNLSSASLMAMD